MIFDRRKSYSHVETVVRQKNSTRHSYNLKGGLHLAED